MTKLNFLITSMQLIKFAREILKAFEVPRFTFFQETLIISFFVKSELMRS